MITILGNHISEIRPSAPRQSHVYNSERPIITYNTKPVTVKEHSGKVSAICLMLKSGGVRAIVRGTHATVMEIFDIDPRNVEKIGWRLESGEYIWR